MYKRQEEEPSVYSVSQGKSLFILYRNVAFHIDDFWELFALSMANIDKTWSICALGTAQNQETVRSVSYTHLDVYKRQAGYQRRHDSAGIYYSENSESSHFQPQIGRAHV